MVLDSRSSYPGTRSYVLKLRRDAEPARGHLVGHLENMASGRRFEFSTPEELLACLTCDAEANAVESSP